MTHFKVVHIATAQSGGAGIAAFRLHQGLQNEGVLTTFLTLKKTTVRDETVVNFKNQPPSFIQKLKNKLVPRVESQHRKKLKGLNGKYEGFSFATSSYKIHEHPLVIQADIIHLHWVAGFLDYPSFFEQVQKPIVWTLHDMNPFQGGFHYKNDEIENKAFSKLNARVEKIKQRSYDSATMKAVVSPSKWMHQQARESKLLSKFNHVQIANGIDENVFSISNKESLRKELNWDIDERVFLFVSESITNNRKNFTNLKKAITLLKSDKKLRLVAIGSMSSSTTENETIDYIGKVSETKELAKLYAAADYFVLPSKEDNLPNVMLEALLSGTPVISTPVGGMKNEIIDGVNGYFTNNTSANALKEVITKAIETRDIFDSTKIRELAIEKYAMSTIVKKYVEVYKSIS